VIGGIAQPANQILEITAAQLTQASFVVGTSSDLLGIRAWDGSDWGDWSFFEVSPPANSAPVTTAADRTVTHGQSLAASSLFSATDANGDAIVKYQFADGDPDATSGYFSLNGVAQPANQIIEVSASDLAHLSFQSGSGSDLLGVRAFDGTDWGAWAFLQVNAPINHAPVTTAGDLHASPGQTVLASSLFSVSDGDGDSIVRYQFADGTPDGVSGSFYVDGVAQPANQIINVAAADLTQTMFEVGTGSDVLGVRTFDGTDWSAWSIFHVNADAGGTPGAPDDGPTITDFSTSGNGIVTISGEAPANSHVSLFDNGSTRPFGIVVAEADGTWSYSTYLSRIPHAFTVSATDATGQAHSSTAQAFVGTNWRDTFESGSGSDLFYGAGGRDTVVMQDHFGSDVFIDFVTGGRNHDVIQFENSTFSDFAEVMAHAQQVGSDVLISLNSTDTLTLKHTDLADLRSYDFQFV
jgi:hypothetical protein